MLIFLATFARGLWECLGIVLDPGGIAIPWWVFWRRWSLCLVPLSSAGLLDWSCYFSTCAVHSVMFWPTRNSSFCWLSSTLPWTPSSTPTATRRWAQPSGRSSAASAVRTPAAPRKAPTARLPPSTTPSWLEFTAMTTLWFRQETQRRSQPSCIEGWRAPPDPNARQGVECERERGKINSCT